MTNTYVWTVQSMQCYPTYQELTDVVFIVGSLVTATDNSDPPNVTSTNIATSIVYDPADPFIPYNELTPNIVNKWVQDMLGTDGVDAIQSILDTQMENIINPPVVTPPLPWAN